MDMKAAGIATAYGQMAAASLRCYRKPVTEMSHDSCNGTLLVLALYREKSIIRGERIQGSPIFISSLSD